MKRMIEASKSSLLAIVAVWVVVMGQYAAAANHCQYYRTYELKQTVSGSCAQKLSVAPWWIDSPWIEVLSIINGSDDDDMNKLLMHFGIPKDPSFGEPSQEDSVGSGKFSQSYGPSPEYSGPPCTQSADLSDPAALSLQLSCDDKKGEKNPSYDCRYEAVPAREGVDGLCSRYGHYYLQLDGFSDCQHTVAMKPGFSVDKDFILRTTTRDKNLMAFNASEGVNGVFSGASVGSCTPSADFSQWPLLTITTCEENGKLVCPYRMAPQAQ